MSKAEARARILAWRDDPVKFAVECFGFEPDQWQADVLALAGKPGRKRIAMKACAGPGKTAIMAILGWHRLACFAAPGEHPKGLAVAVTRDNLDTNLWPEMSKWQGRSRFLLEAFEWTKTRIFCKDHPETWFLAARGYAQGADPATIGRTLSGLHSQFPFFLIDESGDIPPQMLRSAEQALTSCEDGLIATAGNTTSHNGMLYACSVTARDQWDVYSITADPDDPRRTPRVDIEWAREQIETHGRDNPWVMAFILGQFPPGSINALLTVEEVEAAMDRHLRPDSYEWAQKRMGIDVARFGDDRSVIWKRQGLCGAFAPIQMRHQRTTDIAARAAQEISGWGSEQQYIDDTGHWGHGVIDNLIAAGFPAIGIQFHGPPIDPRYRNKRAEMWFAAADWIKKGGALPRIPELIPELTGPTYTFVNGKIQMEDKDQVKARIGRSPDLADALALTFAMPESLARGNSRHHNALLRHDYVLPDYDPMRM